MPNLDQFGQLNLWNHVCVLQGPLLFWPTKQPYFFWISSTKKKYGCFVGQNSRGLCETHTQPQKN